MLGRETVAYLLYIQLERSIIKSIGSIGFLNDLSNEEKTQSQKKLINNVVSISDDDWGENYCYSLLNCIFGNIVTDQGKLAEKLISNNCWFLWSRTSQLHRPGHMQLGWAETISSKQPSNYI